MRISSTIIIFMSIIGIGYGFDVGPIGLSNTNEYISFVYGPSPGNTTLECPVTRGVEVDSVTWGLWEDNRQEGTFIWKRNGSAEATGRLKDVVNLERDSTYLELTELLYKLAGFYSCAVTLTDGTMKEAKQWELLIVDRTSSNSYDKTVDNGCFIEVEFRCYPIFPEPTIHSGMYSKSQGGFYDEVKGWDKVDYDNGSVAYSYDYQKFEITETSPYDAMFLTTVGVTKTDGTYFGFFHLNYSSHLWDKGCADMNLGAHQEVTFSNLAKTCHGDYTPPNWSYGNTATVSCMDGHPAEGNITSLEFSCDPNHLSWSPSPDHLEDLKCDGVRAVASLIVVVVATLLPRLLY